ncbi:hypothetical protein EV182_001036, partial [Spiromyces aspiralis]
RKRKRARRVKQSPRSEVGSVTTAAATTLTTDKSMEEPLQTKPPKEEAENMSLQDLIREQDEQIAAYTYQLAQLSTQHKFAKRRLAIIAKQLWDQSGNQRPSPQSILPPSTTRSGKRRKALH